MEMKGKWKENERKMNEMPSVCVGFSAPLNKTNEWKSRKMEGHERK